MILKLSQGQTCWPVVDHKVELYNKDINEQQPELLESTPDASPLELNQETIDQLMVLKEKGFDLNEILPVLLKKREQEIQEAKQKLATEVEIEEAAKRKKGKAHSSYIPQKIKNILKEEYGSKCAIAHCKEPSKEIHHTARQALSKSHNPLYLAPLCREHHRIAHSIDVGVQEYRYVKR